MMFKFRHQMEIFKNQIESSRKAFMTEKIHVLLTSGSFQQTFTVTYTLDEPQTTFFLAFKVN